MEASNHDFRAWYEPTGARGAKIVVVGTVSEVDGSDSTLVPGQPQTGNPNVLRLIVVRTPYRGFARPHVGLKREIRYEAPAKAGEFTEVHVQDKSGTMKVKVEPRPRQK